MPVDGPSSIIFIDYRVNGDFSYFPGTRSPHSIPPLLRDKGTAFSLPDNLKFEPAYLECRAVQGRHGTDKIEICILDEAKTGYKILQVLDTISNEARAIEDVSMS